MTVVRTCVSERPFIVDTIREFLHARGLAIEFIVYPLLHVERDASGAPTASWLTSASDGGRDTERD